MKVIPSIRSMDTSEQAGEELVSIRIEGESKADCDHNCDAKFEGADPLNSVGDGEDAATAAAPANAVSLLRSGAPLASGQQETRRRLRRSYLEHQLAEEEEGDSDAANVEGKNDTQRVESGLRESSMCSVRGEETKHAIGECNRACTNAPISGGPALVSTRIEFYAQCRLLWSD